MGGSTKKDDDVVVISIENTPVQRALRNSNKRLLLGLLVGGVFLGLIYTHFFRTPASENAQTQQPAASSSFEQLPVQTTPAATTSSGANTAEGASSGV